MKMQKIKLMAVALSSAVLMACGGGGGVAGDNAEFFTSPEEWTLGAPANARKGQCAGAGNSAIFTIVGGQPPFRIHNPHPDILQLDRTVVDGKDPRFKVTTLGTGCGEFVISVHDYHSKVAVIEIELEEGDENDE